MNKFILEFYDYEDDIYRVITDPGNDVAILRESDGFDVSGMTAVFDGDLFKKATIATKLDFEDFTHQYFCEYETTQS